MTPTKKILVCSLNWGLGHATRCIPIIRKLQEHNYEVIIASDGDALQLLQKEFPAVKTLELPSYHISYPKNGKLFKWKFVINSPKMILAMYHEHRKINKWIEEFQLDGIISDNRLGCYSKKVPSVYITHQLKVFSGITTRLTTKTHRFFIEKYSECWVPDLKNNQSNLAGDLSKKFDSKIPIHYLGPISRLDKLDLNFKYDLMVILSGPEPQRGILEKKLILETQKFQGKIVFVKGKIEDEITIEQKENITFYNFMDSSLLEKFLNESKIVLCRSGYTSIMDLATLEKKVFFIPTPGQYEQEYLAKKHQLEGFSPFSNQNDFTIEKLKSTENFKGYKNLKVEVNWREIFAIF